jgi:pimeloyl-ACP methyl ester carboxylesterase
MRRRIAITCFLAALTASFQIACTHHGADKPQKNTASGEMVDLGDYKLRVVCSGNAVNGNPTVIMDAGLGASSETWSGLQPEVARLTRVCAYDRAGVGKSEPSSQLPRTSMQIAQDLHALLSKTGITGPIVLVGHSFGGINVRLYASLYPQNVAGMVLVDSSHEEEIERWLSTIPPEIRREIENSGDRMVRGPEHIDLEESYRQMKAANWRTDVPLIVLSRGKASYNADDYPPQLRAFAPEAEEVRISLQVDLASRSSRGKHIFADKSGHFIHHDQPELVIDAIRQVMEATRAKDSKISDASVNGVLRRE